jgi:hypothetical protein
MIISKSDCFMLSTENANALRVDYEKGSKIKRASL